MTQNELYIKLAKEGLFWGYDKSVAYIGDDLLIEHAWLYGETDDISVLFKNFTKEKIIDVWNKKIVPDERFYGLNYYFALIWFDIDEQEECLKNVAKKYSRYERLKKLVESE